MHSSIAKQSKSSSFTTDQLGFARPQAKQRQADSNAGGFAEAASSEADAAGRQSRHRAGSGTSMRFQVGSQIVLLQQVATALVGDLPSYMMLSSHAVACQQSGPHVETRLVVIEPVLYSWAYCALYSASSRCCAVSEWSMWSPAMPPLGP